MRAIVQRVTEAAVRVDGEQLASIGAGLLVLVGITHTDGPEQAAKLASKVAGLRILRDGDRDEAAAAAVGAPVLVVSQFTLYGDTGSGRRPSWQQAAPGPVAEPLVAAFVQQLRAAGLAVHTGRFGALMAVSSVNDGPFTLMLEV
jgi:D-tyrosyl-tRNA(Tyr) deacylase